MEIYRIYNKINGKSYVGATTWDFAHRYINGKWWKYTHSFHLKRAVKRYGIDAFTIEILNSSIKTQEELFEQEKLYIKQYNSFIPNGYNLTLGGQSPKPNLREYELVDCAGNLYRVRNLAEFCRRNSLNYNQMLVMVSGCVNSSQGFGLSSTPTDKIINQEAAVELENIYTKEIAKLKWREIRGWSKKNNISQSSIERVIKEKRVSKDGWKRSDTPIPKNYKKPGPKYSNIRLLHKDGRKITVNNIYRFCKENKLERGQFYGLIKGEVIETCGWRLPCSKKELIQKKEKRLGKVFRFKRESDGEIVEIKNLRAFCRDNKIVLSSMYGLHNGRTSVYAGFSLPDDEKYKIYEWRQKRKESYR